MEKNQEPRVTDIARPYGNQTILTLNVTTSVKVISIHGGYFIGRHTHELRDELCVVLDGDLVVDVGNLRWTARTGERIWIPRGAVHRVANESTQQRRILEVAFGEFRDTDIDRLEAPVGQSDVDTTNASQHRSIQRRDSLR